MNLLIGIPSTRQYEPFIASFQQFYKDLSLKYKVDVLWEYDKQLEEAQNLISDRFMQGDYTHLMFLDDDHWGHSVDMFDAIYKADKDIISIKSYSRHYPYQCALMKEVRFPDGRLKYAGMEVDKGIKEIDLSGFPMTLIKKDLFLKIEKPYFRAKNTGGTEWATDEEFCERLRATGISIWGCFDYCLPHGDITQDNVIQKRITDAKSEGQRLQEFLRKQRSKMVKEKI